MNHSNIFRISLKRLLSSTKHSACARHLSSINLSHTVFQPPSSESGVPLLLTHGLLGSKFNWNSIAKATAKTSGRRVVAFDARNHGDSPHSTDISYELMAQDVLELSTQLNIPKFVLMGHSMGGRTVMTFALKYPDLLEKLIVVDVSPLDMNSDFPSMKVYLEVLYEIGSNLKGRKIPLSEARKFADSRLKEPVKDAGVRAFLLTNLAERNGEIVWKPNLATLIEKFDEIGKFPAGLLDRKFDKSTLFIRGAKSLYIPESNFPHIKKTFVNAQFETVENAGHWPHAENTGRFMEILLPYLKNS